MNLRILLDPYLARSALKRALRERAHLVQGRLLDVGCDFKPYAGLLDLERHIGMDRSPAGQPDVVGDALVLPFADGSFDSVLCTQVLEHVPEPALAMAEMARVLRAGGVMILTAPQTWRLHGGRHDYFRFTSVGLGYLARRAGLEVVEVAPTCGVWLTVTQRVVDSVLNVYLRGRHYRWQLAASIALLPLQAAGLLLERIAGARGDTLDNVLVARRPETHGGCHAP